MDLCDQVIIGSSQAIRDIKKLIRITAGVNYNVLIHGETGVGKNLVARTIHAASTRKDRPFIEIDCASIPYDLLEEEIFGYHKGALAGADRGKQGKFELAEGGTILFDEIGETSLNLQRTLLRVFEQHEFRRVGGESVVKVNCRVLVTASQDFIELVKGGLFREDLYYRLNVIPIFIPPLRERKEDLEPLFDFFADQFIKTKSLHKAKTPRVKKGMPGFFFEYSWPGNVKELRNTVNRLMLSADWEGVGEELLSHETPKATPRTVLIRKFIEFPPELYQSGMSMLGYFGTIVRKKYPDKGIKVRIEQDELKVRMIIESPEGYKEEVEKTLQQYGQVVKGKLPIDNFYDNRLDVFELGHQLEIARVQLETQRELSCLREAEIGRATERIHFLEGQFEKLQGLLSRALSYSANQSENWAKLVEHVREQDNVIIEEALCILKNIVEKGITPFDEKSVREALEVIKKGRPEIFEHVIDLLKGSVSGVAGNILYNWILPIMGALPR